MGMIKVLLVILMLAMGSFIFYDNIVSSQEVQEGELTKEDCVSNRCIGWSNPKHQDNTPIDWRRFIDG